VNMLFLVDLSCLQCTKPVVITVFSLHCVIYAHFSMLTTLHKKT